MAFFIEMCYITNVLIFIYNASFIKGGFYDW